LHQAITISQDEKGRLGQVLDIETDIGAFAPAYSNRLSIIGLDGEPSYLGIDPSIKDFELHQTKKRRLTKRELEVVRLLSQGYTTEEIGKLLGISIGTVQKHRGNILKKLDCRNTAAVIALCIKLGYV
ncbi:MAG: helix-turn-helix transcriptional regulator, partial [Bacteroidota bacterium]